MQARSFLITQNNQTFLVIVGFAMGRASSRLSSLAAESPARLILIIDIGKGLAAFAVSTGLRCTTRNSRRRGAYMLLLLGILMFQPRNDPDQAQL